MIEEISKKLVKIQTKYPGWFIGLFLLSVIVMLPGIFLLIGNVEPSIEKVLPNNVQEVQTMNDMRAQFGADMIYVLVRTDWPATDVRDPAVVTYIDQLSEKLRNREFILQVNNIADLVKTPRGDIPPSKDVISANLASSPYSAQLMAENYVLTVIEIRADTGASAETISKVVNSVEEDIQSMEIKNPGVKTQITGYPVIDKATFSVIISDFMRITVLSLLLVATLVFLTFRNFKHSVLPLLVVMVALSWMMGMAGYLGLTITVVSMVSVAMIMGLGIDFGIHAVHTYRTYRKKYAPKRAINETMGELLRAMLGASLTTTAGFLALLFGVMTAMQTLGILLALGIMSTLSGAVLLLPVLLYTTDRGAK